MVLFPPSPGGGQEVAHGYKGKGTLLHLLIDAKGNPIAVSTTAANGDERKQVKGLLENINSHLEKNSNFNGRMTVVEADKGYDADWLRQALLIRGFFPLIPYRKIKNRNPPEMDEICKTFNLKRKRWMVERAFSWLKRRCRRLLLRWERIAVIWNGFATLGLIYTWLKNLFG
jgi:transposase